MADVTGGVATAAAAGVTAIFVAAIGVEPQALAWGFFGAVLGAPLAPASGRVRMMAVFIAVVFASAMIGTHIAEAYYDNGRTARNVWALVMALVFHPLSARVVKLVPDLFELVAKAKSGGHGGQGGPQ